MNPWLLLGLGVAWVASIGGAGYAAYSAGQDNVTAFNAKSVEIVAATREAGQQGAAIAIAANRPKNTTIVNEVQREVKTNTVYADCRNTPAGLRGINEALTGKQSQPAGGLKLPGTVPAP
jgi:hypothetical protein